MQCSPTSNFKVGDKVFVKAQFFWTTWFLKKLSEKYLIPYKIIIQPGTLLFTLQLPESMHSVHPVFYMFMLEPTMSNTFSKRIQPASTPVIIDREPKYKISQIVDSKIDYWQTCKLLYKVIWLEYKDTGDEFKWIPTSELTLSQIRYSLVVILELNSVSEVQYKNMMIDRWWKVSIEIIDVVKSEV